MTLPLSPHESTPSDIWHSIYSYYTADMLVDNPDHLKMMESILTKKAPVHFEHYMGWLATRVEPLLTESRKNALSAFPDAEKIHHLLAQLRNEGVDLSLITLSPHNSKMHVDVDDEALASSTEKCSGIEDAIRLGDEIINRNLVKIATRIPGYDPLDRGTDTEKAEHFRAWMSSNSAYCAAQISLNLSDLGLTMFPSEFASYFPNLVILDLNNNKLKSLNLSELPNLLCLYLFNNQLSSISLRNLPQLQVMVLAYNQFTSIVFKAIEHVGQLSDDSSMSKIHLSMHDLNVAFGEDARSEIIKKYNEIKKTDYPDMPTTWSDEFLTQSHGLGLDNEIKELDYPAMPTTWDEFSSQSHGIESDYPAIPTGWDEFPTESHGPTLDTAALRKAAIQFLLQRSGGVIT